MMLDDLFTRAGEARRAGRYDDARRHLAQAADAAKEEGSIIDQARVVNALAQLDRDQARPLDALPRYEAAIRLCRSIDAPGTLAHTERHLGELLCELERLDEADHYLTDALLFYRADEAVGRLALANAIRPLALLREAQGRNAEARPLWEEARELYAEEGVQAGVEECDAHLTP